MDELTELHIENRVEIGLPPERVFEILSPPEAIPDFAPGILDANVVRATRRQVGTALELHTDGGKPLGARILEHAPASRLAIEDELGTINRWVLRETAGGTLAINTIEGDFDLERAIALRFEAKAKIRALFANK